MVPDVVAQQIEKVVDGLPKVSTAKQVVQVKFNAGKVRTEVHLRHPHEALLVDEDRGHGVQVQVVDLKPDIAVTVERDQSKNVASQIVDGIALEDAS